MTHQVTARTTAKTETFLGLMSLMTEAIGIEQFTHIQEDLAEVIVMLSIMRGLVRAAEADAAPNRIWRLHTGLGAAQRGAQLVSQGIAATAGVGPQVRRQWPDGDPDRG